MSGCRPCYPCYKKALGTRLITTDRSVPSYVFLHVHDLFLNAYYNDNTHSQTNLLLVGL